MVRAAASLPLFLVAACGAMSGIEAIGATADSVTYQFPADQEDEATRQAMLYCANLGRSAVLTSAEPEAGGLTLAVYDCR
ncbi:MAG: hypothetical protein ACLQJR_07805 [Stellaceae bacterium]